MATIVPNLKNAVPVNSKVTAQVTTTAVDPARSDRLLTGKSLMTGDFILSPNGRYKFINENGGLTLYDGATSLWTTGQILTTKYHVPKLTMRDDDLLLLSDAARGPWGWTSETRRRISGGSATLVVRDSGDAVIFSEGLIIWATKPELVQSKSPKYEPIDPKADRIKLFQCLPVNQPLNSPNGQFSTILRPDGNLVLRHNASDTVVWSLGSKTQSSPATELRVQYDCKLAIMAADGSQIWTGSSYMLSSINELIAYDNGLVEMKQQEYQGGMPDLWSNGVDIPASAGPISSLNVDQSLLIDQKLISGDYELSFTTNGHIAIRDTRESGTTYYYTHRRTNVEGAVRMTVTSSKYIEFRDAQNKTLCRSKRATTGNSWNVKLVFAYGQAYVTEDAWITDNNQWQGTTPTPPPTLHGSKLVPGEALSVGESLVSGDGSYYMIYQPDGNLVIYSSRDKRLKWSANSQGKGEPGKVTLQEDGNLIVSAKDGKQVYTTDSGVGGGDAVLVLQNDGNAVISIDEQVFWASEDNKGRR